MPQYEFYCHACKKTFTKILTLVAMRQVALSAPTAAAKR
jgi:hypothetical protein